MGDPSVILKNDHRLLRKWRKRRKHRAKVKSVRAFIVAKRVKRQEENERNFFK